MPCAVCNNGNASGATLLQCGRCKQTQYCSRECQQSDWPTHKSTCVRPNYVLHIQLCPEAISWRLRAVINDPCVERTISCPANATFDQLHATLQTAFGWATTHTYDFNILDPEFGPDSRLSDEDPTGMIDAINRARGNIDPNSAREYLPRVVDKAADVRVFADKMHDSQYAHPRTPEKDSRQTKLFQLFDDPKYKDETLVYMYDFGDRWEHLISVSGREPATRKFRCINGVGHGVAEDVVQDGWAPLKEAYRVARPNKEQREKRQWYEREASNGDRHGLGGGREHYFDKDGVNAKLSVRSI